jgi:putative flippase GtrA
VRFLLPRAPLARFLLVGPFGHALGALQYELLWRVNPLDGARAWSTWCLSSALGIAWIHAVHCRFTFGRELGTHYRATLPRAYLAQGASALCASLLVLVLARVEGLHHLVTWAAATALASSLNFLALDRLLGTTTESA